VSLHRWINPPRYSWSMSARTLSFKFTLLFTRPFLKWSWWREYLQVNPFKFQAGFLKLCYSAFNTRKLELFGYLPTFTVRSLGSHLHHLRIKSLIVFFMEFCTETNTFVRNWTTQKTMATQRLAGFPEEFSPFFPPQAPSKYFRTEKIPTPSQNWIDWCCFYLCQKQTRYSRI